MADTNPLEDVLCNAIDAAHGEKVTVGDLLDRYDDRSFGPVFTLMGLLAVVPPISAIPGVPAIAGVIIALFSVQMLFGKDHIWLPQKVEKLSMEKGTLQKAHDKSENVLATLDSLVTDRLRWATSAPMRFLVAIMVTFLALAMIPLELVPFAVAAPGSAITLFGVAILSRDGALMLLAFALSALAFYILVFVSPLLSWLGLG